MKTRLVRVDPAHPSALALEEAGEVLRRGGLVAFPTETVYGLGANALDPEAVGRIFVAKGRPSDNPLIVHVAVRESLGALVEEVPEVGRRLIEAFWPGPLTLVLPRTEQVSDRVTAGLATVAVRMPDHDVALGLIAAAGVPVAAPSANRSGRPSPTTARHVYDDLRGRIDLVLDGGPAGVGVESTVVDVTGDRPVLLRPGGLPLEELSRVAGEVLFDPGLEGRGVMTPKAPGMKYTHYAPQAPLTLIAPRPGTPLARLAEAAWQAVTEPPAGGVASEPGPIGLLTFSENLSAHRAAAEAAGRPFALGELDRRPPRDFPGILALEAGPAAEPTQVAARLFAALRWFDQARVRRIVAEGTWPAGLGFAVLNRLRKAAAQIREV